MLQGVEDLEKSHQFQATNAQTELKKEMNLLQKKILMDTVSIGTFIHACQGLPWLRICCSQHFSQMEKVGAK